MNVLSTVPSDWALIAEGGANLVLSYSGSDASFSSLVLRVRKRKLHAVSEAEDDDEDPAVAFNEQVVDKLMPGLSASLWNASVDEPFLQALAAQVEPHRRPTRREEDELDTKRTRVVLAEDLVSPRIPGERVLTVEIKVCSSTVFELPDLSNVSSRNGASCHPRTLLSRQKQRSSSARIVASACISYSRRMPRLHRSATTATAR